MDGWLHNSIKENDHVDDDCCAAPAGNGCRRTTDSKKVYGVDRSGDCSVAAFAKGANSYGVFDAIFTFIGLDMGLSLIWALPRALTAQRPIDNTIFAAIPTTTPSTNTALARDSELRPSPRGYPVGRCILFEVITIIFMWPCLKGNAQHKNEATGKLVGNVFSLCQASASEWPSVHQ